MKCEVNMMSDLLGKQEMIQQSMSGSQFCFLSPIMNVPTKCGTNTRARALIQYKDVILPV